MGATGLWYDIPRSQRYQISISGQVRRKLKNGRYKSIKTYAVKGKWLAVKVDLEGAIKEMYVHKIMDLTFNIKSKTDHVIRFKNGDIRDPSLHNLESISRERLGKLTGAKSRRKPVAKLDSFGNVIGLYSSARGCAKENYMSYQTIIDRCNGKVKSKFAPDGFQYIWEENLSYN